MMTDRQRAVLAHVVEDPDAWWADALASLGEDAAVAALSAKVARWDAAYEAALVPGYLTRAQREAPPVQTLEQARAEMRSRAAAQRWAVETGGITVAGIAVKTDRESQSLLMCGAAAVAAGLEAPVDWKAASGWVTLDAAQVKGLAAAVAAHVQACFTRERSLCEAIDAVGDLAALAAIDIAAGWPA